MVNSYSTKDIIAFGSGIYVNLAIGFKNKPFVILVCLYGIMTLAIALITAGLPFAAIYLIFDSGNSLLSPASSALGILSLLFACFVFGSILSQAFWVWMSARLGKVVH